MLIVDVSEHHLTIIGKQCERHENNSNQLCGNCVWSRHFKTRTALYDGGRELQIEKSCKYYSAQ
jgi:hypothetical protein